MKIATQQPIHIMAFDSRFAQNFADLNYEWLNEFFVVEPHDTEMLEAPEEYIIQSGGQIFFAQYQDEIVGTVALIAEGQGVFELAKMAVKKEYRGHGIGKKLIQRALSECREKNARKVYLVSNSKLAPAIHLYESFGFTHKPMCDTPYQRCDVRMELNF